MGKYVENNLGKNEVIVKKAQRTAFFLVFTWLKGILFSWLLLIPLIKAIIATVKYYNCELTVTNKRVVGRVGVINTQSLDAPLNKIQNVNVAQGFWGKIFNFGKIEFVTAAGKVLFDGIKSPDAFKGVIMGQIDEYEEARVKQQAAEMANAMAGVLNKQ